jgi:hypothetical protein
MVDIEMFQNSYKKIDQKGLELIAKIEKEMVGLQVLDVSPITLPIKVYEITFDVSAGRPFNLIEEFIYKFATDPILGSELSRTMIRNMTKLDDIFIESIVDGLVDLNVLREGQAGELSVTEQGNEYFKKGMIPAPPKTHSIELYYDYLFGSFLEFAPIFEVPDSEYKTPSYLQKNEIAIEGKINKELLVSLGKTQGKIYENSAVGKLITTIHDPLLTGGGYVNLSILWVHDIVEDIFFPRVIDSQTGALRSDIEKYLLEKEIFPEPILSETEQIPASPDEDGIHELYGKQLQENLRGQRGAQSVPKNQPKIRLLRGSHIRSEFLKAIKSTKERLIIISPWMTEEAVDEELISSFRDVVQRGGTIFLGWGINKQENSEKNPPSAELLKTLEKIKTREGLPGVFVVWLGNKHNKEIIIDERIHLAGSFNWLSYRGDYSPRGEQVYMVTEPQIVAEAAYTIEELFATQLDMTFNKLAEDDMKAPYLFGLSRILAMQEFDDYVNKLKIDHYLTITICKIYAMNQRYTLTFENLLTSFLDEAKVDDLLRNKTISQILSLLKKHDKEKYKNIVMTEVHRDKLLRGKILNENGLLINHKMVTFE